MYLTSQSERNKLVVVVVVVDGMNTMMLTNKSSELLERAKYSKLIICFLIKHICFWIKRTKY